MSSQATAWAWDQNVDKNMKLLLLFLAENADRCGRGPKEAIEDAATACGFGGQTLRDHLESLQEEGLLKVAEGGHYTLEGLPEPKLATFRFGRPE